MSNRQPSRCSDTWLEAHLVNHVQRTTFNVKRCTLYVIEPVVGPVSFRPFFVAVARTRLRLASSLNSRTRVRLVTPSRPHLHPFCLCNVEAGSAVAWRWKARHDAAKPLDRASLSAGRLHAAPPLVALAAQTSSLPPSPPMHGRLPPLPRTLRWSALRTLCSGGGSRPCRAATGDFVPRAPNARWGALRSMSLVRAGASAPIRTHSSTRSVARLPLAARVSPRARRIRAGNSPSLRSARSPLCGTPADSHLALSWMRHSAPSRYHVGGQAHLNARAHEQQLGR